MSGYYTQTRVLPHKGLVPSAHKLHPDGSRESVVGLAYPGLQVTTSFRSGKGEELASSGRSLGYDSLHEKPDNSKSQTFDNGHEFSTTSDQMFCYFPQNVSFSRGIRYSQPSVCSAQLPVNVKFPTIPLWNSSDQDGNLAISRTYPTAPAASLSTMLAELKREGLPDLPMRNFALMKGSSAKTIGGEYLNLTFGIAPLIRDLDKILKAVVQSSKIVQQMQRDSGRVVRRGFSFPVQQELIASSRVRYNQYPLHSYDPINSSSGWLLSETTRTTEMWFSGAYTYYLDPGKDIVGKAKMYEQLANKLLGTRITAATLWELSPWSWLADWFANVGDNITVASAFQSDGLTLKYGYIMRKVTAQTMHSFALDSLPSGKPSLASHVIARSTTKQRRKSSPYGFGLQTESFSDRQWAILGALGLTKAPRSMR